MSSTACPLLGFVRQLQIAHHVPGRIRLKLSGPISAEMMAVADEAKRFGKALKAIDAIRSISLNPLARSCVVEYDARAIPPSAWGHLISGEATPEGETLRLRLLGAMSA